jgi:large subunit ribosomal protein L32
MAVPKKKTSKSKRDMRRSHLAVKSISYVIDKETGEARLPHQIDQKTGRYRGRSVIITRQKDIDEDAQ